MRFHPRVGLGAEPAALAGEGVGFGGQALLLLGVDPNFAHSYFNLARLMVMIVELGSGLSVLGAW